MQPEEAATLFETMLLPSLRDEHPLTKRVLEAIPSEKIDYRPHPVAKTTMELARHLAASEKRLLDGAIRGEIQGGAVLPENIPGPKELAVWYSDNLNHTYAQLEQLSPEQLAKSIAFRSRSLPAVLCVHFALKHSIHHRGQLAGYLRAMGARVPSIYGESYDDAEARKAAQTQSGATQ